MLVILFVAMLAVTSCSKKETVTTPFGVITLVYNVDEVSSETKAALLSAMQSAVNSYSNAEHYGIDGNEMTRFIDDFLKPTLKDKLTQSQITELAQKGTYIIVRFTSTDGSVTYVEGTFSFD